MRFKSTGCHTCIQGEAHHMLIVQIPFHYCLSVCYTYQSVSLSQVILDFLLKCVRTDAVLCVLSLSFQILVQSHNVIRATDTHPGTSSLGSHMWDRLSDCHKLFHCSPNIRLTLPWILSADLLSKQRLSASQNKTSP